MSQIYKNNGGGGPATDLHVARFIVSPGGLTDGANYTTIGDAYTAAVATGNPQTVFVQDGSYTENINLAADINLTSFTCDATTPNVTIIGKLTAAYSGACSVSGIEIQTNSDFCIVNSGSNATNLYLNECNIIASNHSAIDMTNTGGGLINLNYCKGNVTTTGISFCNASSSSNGSIRIESSEIGNTGISTTVCNIQGGTIGINNGIFNNPITTSNAAFFDVNNSQILAVLNAGGSNQHTLQNSVVTATGVSAINITTPCNLFVTDTTISCDTSPAIAGNGTLSCTPISWTNTSSTIQNTITVVELPFTPIAFSSPLTTKGDIYGFSTVPARIPVGSNNQVLTADSTQPLGVKWATPSGGTDVSFLAYLSASVPNATGNGAVYQVAFDAVAFDSTSSFTTGASAHFTAPSTGKYILMACVNTFLNANSASDTIVEIICTSRSVQSQFFVGSAFSSSLTTVPTTAVIDMTAGDTAQVNVTISGTGSNTCQIQGSGSPYETYFSGVKVA